MKVDTGLASLCAIAGYYRIAAQPDGLARELALTMATEPEDIMRAALRIGLKSRLIHVRGEQRLKALPAPAIACLNDGQFAIVGEGENDDTFRLIDPVNFTAQEMGAQDLLTLTGGRIILVQRRIGGPGIDAKTFGFHWFAPSLWRYRKPLGHALLASLILQIFALVSPLFFQVVVDKVLAHRSYSTLVVLVAALVVIGLFEALLQYLRTYVLTHTTNRIDVELGQRLFRQLLSLPMSYFEKRPAGQTVARVRELETVRAFLTGQGLFCGLDFIFATIFILVLFIYSQSLAWIVVASIPFYVCIGASIRPLLKVRIDEQFNRGALSQQLLVESVVGVQTLKAAAVEPMVSAQWEERLAGYVRASFRAAMLAAKGQNAIQYVSKVTTALLLLFGAQAVINGDMTIGALVAFNMIAGQVAQPVLRLSQLWQDFQQVQVSVARIADILNAIPEPKPDVAVSLPAPRGASP